MCKVFFEFIATCREKEREICLTYNVEMYGINESNRCICMWPESINSKTIFLLVVTSLRIFDKTMDKSEYSLRSKAIATPFYQYNC